MPKLARFAVDWLIPNSARASQVPYTLEPNADGTYPLEFNSEQTPHADKSGDTCGGIDPHGLRSCDIDWRVSDSDVMRPTARTVLLRDTVNRSGVCRLELDETQLRSVSADRRRSAVTTWVPRVWPSDRTVWSMRIARVWGAERLRCELRGIPDQQPCESDADHRCVGGEASGTSSSTIRRSLTTTVQALACGRTERSCGGNGDQEQQTKCGAGHLRLRIFLVTPAKENREFAQVGRCLNEPANGAMTA